MADKFTIHILAILLIFGIFSCKTNIKSIEEGNWSINYQTTSKTVDYIYKGKPILTGVFVKVKTSGKELSSKDSKTVRMSSSEISGGFGNGMKYTFEYQFPDDIRLLQIFSFYPQHDYFFTEVIIRSDKEISTNYMAPVVSHTPVSFLPSGENRMLAVPFDNDAWVRYQSLGLDTINTSYEVAAVFNGWERMGLVMGSVDHDTWKTGIAVDASGGQTLNSLECYAGITSNLTRDVLPHGSISGKELKSPRIFVGFFNDWRDGLEHYAGANAAVAPPRKWAGGTPFGWNSWGSMQDKVNYEGAVDVADFFRQELQPAGFENNGTVYVDLDSYWDNFTDEQLKQFADHCKANGQVPGIYWGPFADWGKNPEATMKGSAYKYKDAYLYANGKEQTLDGAYAIDPTHPGTQRRIDYFVDRFLKAGYQYVKLDFMGHGALEADSHFDKATTTGIQAYNAGLKYLVGKLGEDMYIALSIAPAFPSQYGHSRRISCDAWGDIGSTEYTLNSLSFGWWLDGVYTFNDADHLVLNGFIEGENRARITSGAITGIYMLGDNFSRKGSCVGDRKARELALRFATNEDINNIARMGRSFRPVEGYRAATESGAESEFTYQTDKYVYWVVFNYGTADKMVEVVLERIGLPSQQVLQAKELWSQESVSIKDKQQFRIPAKDVCIFRIDK